MILREILSAALPANDMRRTYPYILCPVGTSIIVSFFLKLFPHQDVFLIPVGEYETALAGRGTIETLARWCSLSEITAFRPDQ